MNKKTVAVVFGGCSSEHEVSCVSATTVISNINTEEYDIIMIGITKEGRWLKVENIEAIQAGTWTEGTCKAVISPDREQKAVLFMENGEVVMQKVDVVFPVMHGMNGEDGTIQGLLELADIPYVGCGVLASAVSMDKLYTKIIVDTLGIRQAKYVSLVDKEIEAPEAKVAEIEEKLGYPVFIKPSNAGSSQGVSKAHDREELLAGMKVAAEHDRKILVEEAIVGRELECAVLGGREVKASGIGEILAAAEFYDYEAKYHNAESKTVLSPKLPDGKAQEIAENATRIFRAVDGFGLSRVDFFMENGTNEIIFNEINTLPGFTAISMYPMLWEAKGISKPVLVSKLLDLAMQRK